MICRDDMLEGRFPPRLPLLPPRIDVKDCVTGFGFASGSLVDEGAEGGDDTGFG